MANKVFKSALGGYNKNDVNTYIAAVSAEMKSKEELHQFQIDRMTKEKEAVVAENEKLKAQLDELAFEVYSCQEKNALDAEQISVLEQRIGELEDSLKEAEAKSASEEEIEKIRDQYKAAANEYYEEVLLFVSEIQEYLDGFAREVGHRSAELSNRIQYMTLAEKPEPEQITGEFSDKSDVVADMTEDTAETKSKTDKVVNSVKRSTSFEDKIDHFIKSTVAAINAFRGK